jgi:predicted ribosomally synthesized peptide with SipW-like signal peptide
MGSGWLLRHHHRERSTRCGDDDESVGTKSGPFGAFAYAKEPREAGGVSAIVGLSLAFIMALGMGVSGTLAYITDTQTSTGNLLAAGTLDLETNNNNVDGVTRTLYASSMSPGDTAGPTAITLKNTGTTDGATLDIVFSYAESDGSPTAVNKTDDDVAAVMEVVTLSYNGASLLGSISDTNSNGYKDVEELALTSFIGLSGLTASASKEFVIAVRLREETPNNFQSDGITITMTFTLKQ